MRTGLCPRVGGGQVCSPRRRRTQPAAAGSEDGRPPCFRRGQVVASAGVKSWLPPTTGSDPPSPGSADASAQHPPSPASASSPPAEGRLWALPQTCFPQRRENGCHPSWQSTGQGPALPLGSGNDPLNSEAQKRPSNAGLVTSPLRVCPPPLQAQREGQAGVTRGSGGRGG